MPLTLAQLNPCSLTQSVVAENNTAEQYSQAVITIKKNQMKKSMMLLGTACFFAALTNAQTDEVSVKKDLSVLNQQEAVIKSEKRKDRKKLAAMKGNTISSRLKAEFYSDFGNVPVTQWERTANFDEVSFVKDAETFTAFYDTDTKLIGTSSEKTFADLPSKAQQEINKHYKDYTTEDVIFFDDNELNETDMILYNQQFDDADNYFVELKKDNKKIVLQVDVQGNVSYFSRLR